MNLKEVFSINLRKLILSVIVFTLLPVIKLIIPVVCVTGPCDPQVSYIPLLSTLFLGFEYVHFSLMVAIGVAVAYVISCFLLYIFSRISSETKQAVKENLKPSLSKLILTGIGLVSIGAFMANPLPGTQFFHLLDILPKILLPFTAITNILYYTNLASLFAIVSYIKIPNVNLGYGFHSATLSVPAFYTVAILLIIEWYLVSCLLVYFYNKIKEWRKNGN